MARYTGPKMKLMRRFGLAEPNGKPLRGRPRRKSDYGLALEEKQKLKFVYGLMERQLRRYVREAVSSGGDPRLALMQKIESRLDNVVYRLGLAKTREQARQLVNHGHVLVDNQKVDIPSYNLKEGETISLRPKYLIAQARHEQILGFRQERVQAAFLEYLEDGGRYLHAPLETDLPAFIDVARVLQFYHKMI